MNLYFLKHNNYYNRRYKPITSLTGATVLGYLYNVSNFDPADGVDTVQETAYETFTDIPDYMLAMEGEEIVSRWYVVEAKRIRGGKYRLDLHRDVIADYFADIEDAPMFIEKGYVPYNNPLIFNKEQMSFNKVKKHEILLNNGFDGAWICAYYARNASEGTSPTASVDTSQVNYDLSLGDNDITSWEYWNYTTGSADTPNVASPFCVGVYDTLYRVHNGDTSSSFFSFFNEEQYLESIRTNDIATAQMDVTVLQDYWERDSSIRDMVYHGTELEIGTKTNAQLKSLQEQNGKIIKYTHGGNPKYCRVKVKNNPNVVYSDYVTAGQLYIAMYNWAITAVTGGTISGTTFRYEAKTNNFYIELEDITSSAEQTFTLSDNRRHLEDAPYDMLVFPYFDGTIIDNRAGDTFGSTYSYSKNEIMGLTMDFAKNMGSRMYDIQLLPYCPIVGISQTSKNQYIIDANGGISDLDIAKVNIKLTSTVSMVLFNASRSKFSLQINMSSNTEYNYLTKIETDAIERKVKNECDLVRISSPNGSNSFDFSPQMNNGFDYIQVDCTYKPYNPYIHVAPDFAGLYGDNFGDTRGLVVQGDFSLPIVTDAWVQYEINNKNYANVFDRETQSLEFREGKRRTQQVASIIAGSVGGAGAGLALGSIGGPVGTVLGVAAGAGLSAFGGAVDYNMSKQLYEEQMNYRQDMYNMNLENIQARPNGLAKTSAFTNNNKIYPFIEYYTATDVEKEALRSKIKYNGMTIGVIGKIMDYVGSTETYVKGSLITSNISDDYHTVQAINNELNMGIRIGG